MIAYQGGITVLGSGYTLPRIAEEVANPSLFRYADGQATCTVPFILRGQMTMRPGESLTMANSSGEWARRLVYLMGEMDFRDCAIAGAYWVDVTPEARGQWRNVRIVSGDNRDSHYPLLYFRSSTLSWEGGLLDAHAKPDVYSPIAFSVRGGYYPADVRNTIRGVAIKSFRFALLDVGDRHDVDLTFSQCTFLTDSRQAQAIFSSHVNVSDLGRSRFQLVNCRRVAQGQEKPFDEIEVTGAAAEVVVGDGKGRQRRHGAPDLTPISEKDSRNLLPHLSDGVESARSLLRSLVGEPRLRGTLFYPRTRLAFLEAVLVRLRSGGFYSATDERVVAEALDEVQDALTKAPQTLVTGSPFHPLPKPLPVSPPQGQARIEEIGAERVRVINHESVIVYDGNADGKGKAAFTDESHIRGRKIFDAYPPWGGPSVRHFTPIDSSLMAWELPWRTQIVQQEGRIVGFSAEQRGERYGARVTSIFFYDLPDVILYEVESLQRDGPFVTPRVRFAAYAVTERRLYNGMRFWNDNPDGFKTSDGAQQGHRSLSEPDEGCFLTFRGNQWYYPTLRRGTIVAQYNGYNDWQRNPPCGYIVKQKECAGLYTNLANYYAHVVELHRSSPPSQGGSEEEVNPGLTFHLLWFEGAGLGCWENIFNLDDAFNNPCLLAPLVLTTQSPLKVELLEPAGLKRNVEIVILPQTFNALQTERPVFRGPSTVLLLRDVPPRSRTFLGTLPVSLREVEKRQFVIESHLPEPLKSVEIHLPCHVKEVRAVQHGRLIVTEFQRSGDEVVYSAVIAPGRTEVQVVP